MGNCNKTNKQTSQVNFHRQVVSLLASPKPIEACELKLAYYLANIVREYTGDHIMNNLQMFSWPQKMGIKSDAGSATRRTRMLDRMVSYACEFDYSHEDVYNAFYCLCPVIDNIIKINKGQTWESTDDWAIYDIYAKLALLCVPNKSEEFLVCEAKKVVAQINSIYTPTESEKVREFCKFLEMELRETHFKAGNGTFGKWVCKSLEHFSQIALNCGPSDTALETRLINTAHYILHFSFMHPKVWYQSPTTLIAAAVNSAVTFLGTGSWGNWFRVEYRTAVRDGILLDTNTVALLNPGQLVHVVEQFGRRVQVDQPVRGFCSLHDGAGLNILTPVSNVHLLAKLTGHTHESLQSPFRDMTRWIFTDRTSNYLNLKSKFSQKKYDSVASLQFQNGQLIQADEIMTE